MERYGYSKETVEHIRKEKDELRKQYGDDESQWMKKFDAKQIKDFNGHNEDALAIQRKHFLEKMNRGHDGDNQINKIAKEMSEVSGVAVTFGTTKKKAELTVEQAGKLLNYNSNDIASMQRCIGAKSKYQETTAQIDKARKLLGDKFVPQTVLDEQKTEARHSAYGTAALVKLNGQLKTAGSNLTVKG